MTTTRPSRPQWTPQSDPTDDLPGCVLVAGDVFFPVTATRIIGQVDGTGVVWTVVQTFANPLTEPAEAVYSFPLPHDGAVNAMAMTIGDRIIEAEIKERGEAVVEYREAVVQGHTASLVTQERAEIFSTTVGNIHPGESISVTIVIHGSVSVDGDVATLRFPTMIKDRYSDGSLPDAAVIEASSASASSTVESSVVIEFAGDVAGLACETFPNAAVAGRTVTIADESALRSDVVLRWDVPRTVSEARWTPDSGPDGASGTLEVKIRTHQQGPVPERPRAVSILIDRSGSMEGHYMAWAKRIAEAVIASLGDDDLVHVLTFDTAIEAFGPTSHGFVPATRGTRSALLRELAGVNARGGTHLDRAIVAAGAALALLEDDDRERIVVLITDGAIGDEATAMNLRRRELAGARVISVAVGENANGFLQALSANGTCLFLEAAHQVAEVTRAVADRIRMPAHRNSRLIIDGLQDQAPSLAPDIYPDLLVTLWGRMPRPAEGAAVTVACDDGVVAVIPVAVSDDASITTRWANARIKALDADVMAAEDAEMAEDIEKQIVDLSVTHRVLSTYTAWLAVDRSRTTDTVVTQTINHHVRAVPDAEFLRFNLINTTHDTLLHSAVHEVAFSEAMDRVMIQRPEQESSLGVHLRVILIPQLQALLDDGTFDPHETQTAIIEVREFLLNQLRGPLNILRQITVIHKLLEKFEVAASAGRHAHARGHLTKLIEALEKMSNIGPTS